MKRADLLEVPDFLAGQGIDRAHVQLPTVAVVRALHVGSTAAALSGIGVTRFVQENDSTRRSQGDVSVVLDLLPVQVVAGDGRDDLRLFASDVPA